VCFKRISSICIAKFGNLEVNGVKGSKLLGENVIFGIAYPDLPLHYATFYGATIMIKGSLLLSAPIVKHFWAKKTRPVLGHNLMVRGYGFCGGGR